jgi:two-component system, cell cycle sensor histidine kinase and response regulator CckA
MTSTAVQQTTLPPSLPVPCNILVVDDDPANLLLTTRVLEKYGCRVLMANSPTKAISLFEQHIESIDIMVTDISMPEMTGYELAERLRDRNPLLPILFMSASVDRETAAQRRFSVISKPFTFVGLINSVAAVLQSYPIPPTSVFHLNIFDKGEQNAYHRPA